jgi:hypothetical protein
VGVGRTGAARVCLVDEDGGAQRLPWRFVGEFLRRELARLVVDQG